MRFLKKIIGRIFKKVFALDKLKERTIKEGPLRGLFYYGTYSDKIYFSSTFEEKVVKVIKKNIDKGNIYDIGAHFGSYSSLFAKLVKEGKVYSFEPNPYCFERLGRTVSLNSLNNKIKIFNFGIGDTNGVGEMMILLDNLARSTCDQGLKYHYRSRKHFIKNIKIKSLDNLRHSNKTP